MFVQVNWKYTLVVRGQILGTAMVKTRLSTIIAASRSIVPFVPFTRTNVLLYFELCSCSCYSLFHQRNSLFIFYPFKSLDVLNNTHPTHIFIIAYMYLYILHSFHSILSQLSHSQHDTENISGKFFLLFPFVFKIVYQHIHSF